LGLQADESGFSRFLDELPVTARRLGLWIVLVARLVAPAVAVAQSPDRIVEGHYQKGLASYKSKPPDYASAAVWYRKAAELGHARAQNDLGWLYQNGWGVSRDDVQAVHWYRLAARQGNAAAQTNIGWMYQYGRGVPRDYAEAVKWYRLAVAQGEPVAADNLGILYRDGVGVQRDCAEALALFRKAAAARYAFGQTDLGWMYHNGWGVPRDYAEAMRWYRLAAAQGDTLAENNIGVMDRDSLGVYRDLDQALAWFRKAAAAGDARAQQSLRHLESLQRGMDPWPNILAGKSVRVAISAKGMVYLFAEVSVRLPSGKAINVEIPIKVFTDPELRDLGILKPDGSIAIKEKPNLPYKPMRAASGAQRRRFFEEYPKTAIAIHWPPYVVTAPGLDQQPPGTKEIIRETIERLYER
jgi:TPR repeat protein